MQEHHWIIRHAEITDVEILGRLMEGLYETPEQCLQEMTATLKGKYGPYLDFASFLAFENGRAISACLVTLWKDKPLLAFLMTDPEYQKQGLSRLLIECSATALANRGYKAILKLNKLTK